MLITNDLLCAFLACPYKAFRQARGDHGDVDACLALDAELNEAFRLEAKRALPGRLGVRRLPPLPEVPATSLAGVPPLVGAGTVTTDDLVFSFDALERHSRPSELGRFHYAPILLQRSRSIGVRTRLILAFGAKVLESLQGTAPEHGRVLAGSRMQLRTLRFESERVRLEPILGHIRGMVQDGLEPDRLLNRHCQACCYRIACRKDAEERDELGLLSGMTERQVRALHTRGIFTVHQLSYTFRARRRSKRSLAASPFSQALRALAIREDRIHVVERPALPEGATKVYLDLEGDESGRLIYLIGALLDDGHGTEYRSWWADTPEDQEAIERDFVSWLGGLADPHVYHWGRYDSAALRRMLGANWGPRGARFLKASVTNVLSRVYGRVYFTTYSHSLKEIASSLGFRWSDPTASGRMSLVWRHRWDSTRDPESRDRLLTYNREDCEALALVCRTLTALNSDSDSTLDHELLTASPTFPDHADWGDRGSRLTWVDAVTRHAYFDYQQCKVYARTEASVGKAARRRSKRPRRAPTPNKTVDVSARACWRCGSRRIKRLDSKRHRKFHIDLKISSRGIRRWIVRYRTTRYACHDCDRTFLPAQYRKIRRFGHDLLAWVVYENVAHGVPLTRIRTMLRDCFGLSLRYVEIFELKSYAASYYKQTHSKLLARVVGGRLIHADETGISPQERDGYVWVLTNMTDVVYLYRKSRSSDFLKDLLSDFSGVLVSDFYAGYDGLPCVQQKCLIHLIWDVNRDVRKHPFDRELRSIAAAFGELLRSIVATIDRFGLKARFLRKEKKGVRAFYRALAKMSPQSDISAYYVRRFLRYHERLFSFLDHDGVPWNNNNAEHAIKYVAKFRRGVLKRTMTEAGLERHMILLSLYVSCHYRGLSFLDFLRSKERDLDAYDATIAPK